MLMTLGRSPASNVPFGPPLKHSVYPRRARVKLMTLIAGFRFNNGVLLCSDTQMEGAVIKTHGPKICTGEFPGGSFAIAYAGHAGKAQAAIDACARRLSHVKPGEDVHAALQSTVEAQYRKLVHKDPSYPNDHSLYYCLMFAIWVRDRSHTFLFVADDVALVESPSDNICRGVGLELGHYITDPIFARTMDVEQTLFLAVYMMARASSVIQGIGGMSHYAALNDDGTQSPVMGVELDEGLKENAKGWDVSGMKALMEVALKGNPARQVISVRDFSMMRINAILFWQTFTHGDPTISQYLQSTKASASHPPPSQESPGGTGES
jgi:hypothetical protein